LDIAALDKISLGSSFELGTRGVGRRKFIPLILNYVVIKLYKF